MRNPASPALKSSYNFFQSNNEISGLAIADPYIYVNTLRGGLYILLNQGLYSGAEGWELFE